MIGKTLAQYRIESELGRGGMGVIYAARDQRLRRDVAIKLLAEEVCGQGERRSRTLSEARAAAALNHPNICTVYEVVEDDGHIFIVMERVAGRTLREMISEAPLRPLTLARIGVQVAEALAEAHAQGVIHGDIKPANIMVQTGERVKLLDFGIASQLAEETLSSLTAGAKGSSGSQAGGTPAYMAPEQLRGEAARPASDLFSLGIVLYECLAGHRPFPGPTASALMNQILREAPAPLSSAAPGVPAELERIVHKLIEKQPASRYAATRELQADLENLARSLDLGVILPAAVAEKTSVGVLPFRLLTPNREDEYLGVALADALINSLSACGCVLVRPTSTVMRYAGQQVETLAAARELGVNIIVDGSLQKHGTRLRAHVQAWKAPEGTPIWSGRYDAEFTELFAMQDQMAEALSKVLGISGKTAPIAEDATPPPPPTRNSAASDLFLRAVDRLSRPNKWDTRAGIEMLEEAVNRDPKFTDAWARLAEGCVLMAVIFEPTGPWLKRAEQAIRKAMALDRNNAEAHCARGRVLWTPARGFQNVPALRALATALRISPGNHQARTWQCLIFMHVGLLEEAHEGLMTALGAHPEDAFTISFLAQNSAFRGNYDQAEEFHVHARRIDSGNLWNSVFHPSSLIYAGKLDRAIRAIASARQTVGDDPWIAACEALLLAKQGDRKKADKMTGTALTAKKMFLHTHHMWHTAAATYALLGKHAQAIALLRKCQGLGLPNYPAFRDDPHFDSLRRQPAFLKLLADLKRQWEGFQREFGTPTNL